MRFFTDHTRDKAGEVTGFVVYGEDVTDIKKQRNYYIEVKKDIDAC